MIRQFHLQKHNQNEVPHMTYSSDESCNASDHENTGLDGIVLCIPTMLHSKYIKICAKYGLAIFCEKPIAMNPNEIQELYDLCEDHNVQLCCGFQRRFDESYIALAEAIRRGDIGNPISAQIFFGDNPCPSIDFLRQGGNIFDDLCIHDVDFIRYALQDEVQSVYATSTCTSKRLKRYGIHDTAVMVLTFKSGCIVTLNLSRWSSYGYDQRCDVFGNKGIVSVHNQHTHSTVLMNGSGEHHAPLQESFGQRFQQAFVTEMDAYADVLIHNRPWPITVQDCCAVQSIAYAAKQSAETGCSVTLS